MQLGLPFGVACRPRVPAEPAPPEGFAPPPLPEQPGSPAPFANLYFVRHRRARRYVLRVDLDGRVRVTIPRGGSKREAEAFAHRQEAWIRNQLATRAAGPAMAMEETRRLRLLAKAVLPPRLRELAALHGLTVTRISIRDQRSRWGSCGHDGHICLNWRLVRMPEWVRDYVLVHELMHLRRMDPSPEYWALVAAAYPAYETARAWLRAHGPGLR